MDNIKRMREERARLWTRCEELMTRSGDMSGEEREEYRKVTARIDELKGQIDEAEDFERRRAEMNVVDRNQNLLPGAEQRSEQRNSNDYDNAYGQWLRYGVEELSPEQRSLLREGFVLPSGERRAQSLASGGAGAYTVAETMANKIVAAMKQFGGMRQARTTKITTSNGGDLIIPTNDDTGNVGALVSEGVAISEQDTTFAVKTLGAYTYTSKAVRISLDLIQDSAFNVEDYVAGLFGMRIGRIQNTHLTTGDGSNKPYGILTDASNSGVTSTDANTIGWINLLGLVHSVDPAYRQNAQFMFSDSALLDIRSELDGDSRPIWQPGTTVGAPDRILGYEYVINQDMPAPTTGNKAVLFGDFSYYWIRDVRGFTSIRLVERYAEYLHVALLAHSRVDGLLTNTAAVKYLQMD